MLRTKNSNRISPNENSSSLASGFIPCSFLLLFPVNETRPGEVLLVQSSSGREEEVVEEVKVVEMEKVVVVEEVEQEVEN